MIRVHTATLLLLALGASAKKCNAQVVVYKNDRFHYVLDYPASWHHRLNGGSVLVIFSYPASIKYAQENFPKRSAEVYVVPVDSLPLLYRRRSVDEWIKADQGHFLAGPLKVSKDPGPPGNSEGPSDITRAVFPFGMGSDDPVRMQVVCYFLLRGRPFQIRLQYWQGDPRGPYYESAAQSILYSMRSTE
jgi:hypothetical protein